MENWHYADVWDTIAALRGDTPALIHGPRRVSWHDLSSRADALAASFVEGGARRGDRVAMYLTNCPEYLEGIYATYKAGLTPVNTNFRYRPDEIRYLWEDADAIAVVFHGCFTDTAAEVRGELPAVQRWLWVDDGSGPCPAWAEAYEDVASTKIDGPYQAPWGRSGDDIIMIYTGGTTGMPKGVMWRHHDLYLAFNTVADPAIADLAAVRNRVNNLADPPRGLPASPLMHATGFMFSQSMLTQGGTVVTLENRRFDPADLLDVLEVERVAAMAMVGDAFGRPLLSALDEAPDRWDLSSLTLLVSAGVMWSGEVKEGLARHLPSTLLVDLLGSTEAHSLGSAVGAGDTARFKLGPDATVVTEDGRRAGVGEPGLLAVAGPSPVGYHKDPDKTARTFLDIDGVRHTVPGDWARLEPDGTLTLLGRGSLCINTGGEKVFPEEVEEALKTHKAVRDATVVGIPDQRMGEVIAAAVELIDGAEVTSDELIAHTKKTIAAYKAPRRVLIVDSVGRAPNGKADYAGIRQRILNAPKTPATTL